MHENLGDIKCDKCDYGTTEPGNLKRHIRSVHMGTPIKKEGSTTDYLSLQLKLEHVKIVQLKCHKCNYATSTGQELTRHMEGAHHKEIVVKSNPDKAKVTKTKKCQACEFVAETDITLTDHIMTSHILS